MYDLQEFLEPVNIDLIGNDIAFNDSQMASTMAIYSDQFPDVDDAEIVIAGINEFRGQGLISEKNAADAVREQLYKLYFWHKDMKIADIGNIRCGSSLNDSYSSVKTVIKEFVQAEKTVVIIGGSHDNTLGQYRAYTDLNQFIEATVIDSNIDLHSESSLKSESFLMEMLTGEPNFVKHYNHIGFQSYFVHPHMLETMDKLRFDCHRVGMAREELDEMEPVMRNSDLISFDVAALKFADAPAGGVSPSGFTGDEGCSLARFAGLSRQVSTFGIYGLLPDKDSDHITALQVAQMIWYFIDGKSRSKHESSLKETHNFNEYYTSFADTETVFYQSKKTGRWWMQLPDKKLIACSYNDYLYASNNEIPERWLRAQEREI